MGPNDGVSVRSPTIEPIEWGRMTVEGLATARTTDSRFTSDVGREGLEARTASARSKALRGGHRMVAASPRQR